MPSYAICIIKQGFSRRVVAGDVVTKDVFGCIVAGVYVLDQLQAAHNRLNILVSGGPNGRPGFSGSEVASADGILPVQNLFRCVAILTVVS